jgi:signal transduction histidine kinase
VRLAGSKHFSQDVLEVLGKVYEDRYHKFVIFAGAHDIYGLSKLRNLRNTLLILFLASISLTALAGWIYAGRALTPLSRVIKDVKRLDPEKLDMRLTESSHQDEIGRLIGTFNMLLERIEKAVNLQKLFITGASHELKNPLTSITSQLQVALLRERSAAEYKTLISSILEDITLLNKTTNDLMEFARLSHEKQVARGPIRIDDVIWQAAEFFSRTKPDYRVEVRMDQLPPDENMLIVYGHGALLHVALVNLIDNACKFSPDHSCVVELSGHDGRLRVAVRDKGPGIAEHQRPYIFEPFYRGDSTAQSQGHGVGLALTKKIFELHGVELHLDTAAGKGTMFTAVFDPSA